MVRKTTKRIAVAAWLALAAGAALPAGAGAAKIDHPEPGSPAYHARDAQNILDAYGRQTAWDGQLSPKYIEAQNYNVPGWLFEQIADQLATPNRPVISAGQVFPGWNQGNPYRRSWEGTRGQVEKVAYTNRYGALLRGHVWAPLEGARDPYNGKKLKPPFPLVVITTGSIQGSERMYTWAAHDLAERGYVVLTYDVQGQGTSETLPHDGPLGPDWPWCDFTAELEEGESGLCPGVPFQQSANFVKGTEDSLDFALSAPKKPYENPKSGQVRVNEFNPFWKLINRKPFKDPLTKGRRKRVAIVGHSAGAGAVSRVQGTDKRVATAVAWDKLAAGDNFLTTGVKPKVPSLGIQSEYGFTVAPYWFSGEGITPGYEGFDQAPDPMRERDTGFEGFRKKGVDSMVIVPRASTHLEYTDISWALPASRYGQVVSSYYTQAWLDKYLKHKRSADRHLRSKTIRYLEPNWKGLWKPVRLDRNENLSFYFCSGWDFRTLKGKRARKLDINGVGCDAG